MMDPLLVIILYESAIKFLKHIAHKNVIELQMSERQTKPNQIETYITRRRCFQRNENIRKSDLVKHYLPRLKPSLG